MEFKARAGGLELTYEGMVMRGTCIVGWDVDM
jgi:hypothetical protein